MDFDVQNHARTRALLSDHHVRSGQFVVRYNPHWASPFANYAIPDDDALPTRDDINALVGVFRTRDRVPRVEYLPSCAPQVEQALLAAGFTAGNRAVVMACSAETLLAPKAVSGLVIGEPANDTGLLTTAMVQHTGYAEPGAPGPGEIAWLHKTVEDGGVVALATAGDGTAVGAGVCSAPVNGLSELAGLAVAVDFRRRGIGAAVSACLTATALGRGCRTVWLEPGDADIGRIYARIGYRAVGEKLNISLR